ncbi:hypothetical protein F4804DRAFT_65893 [Jackrogersella minutella]|nr:hypothetical protein F4804DRAFT_65893 [Jackrogersella minutella]
METGEDAPSKRLPAIAIDTDGGAKGEINISLDKYYDAPSSAGLPPAELYYFSAAPFQDLTIIYRTPCPTSQRITGWHAFPPRPLPRLDLVEPKRATGKGLLDVEEFIDGHIKRSTALQEAMHQVKECRISLRGQASNDPHGLLEPLENRQLGSDEAPDVSTQPSTRTKTEKVSLAVPPDNEEDAEKDQLLLAEMQRMFCAFTSIEHCENHASACHRASENLEREQQLPPRTPSKAELLFGSDGSSPEPGLPTDSQLYFVGSPMKACMMPFDKAVEAGLENLGGKKPRSPSIPSTLEVASPSSQTSLPAAPFLFKPPPGPPNNNDLIPEWFPLLKIPVEGCDLASRWKTFLAYLITLEKKAKEDEKKPKWDKMWHDADPKWPQPHRAKKGGWWKCRSGPGAPKAEAQCYLCHAGLSQRRRARQQEDPENAEEKYKEMMDAIDEAMKQVAEKDKAAALEMLRRRDQNPDTEDQLWLEDTQKSNRASAEKKVYQRSRNYSLLRGYEWPADDVTH